MMDSTAAKEAAAARTEEGIGVPDRLDEVTPEWTHGSSGSFLRRGDEESLNSCDLEIFCGWFFGTGWRYDDRVSGSG